MGGLTTAPQFNVSMKTYSVRFSEPVAVPYNGMHFDAERHWVDGRYTEMEQHVILHSLASAKRLIKQNRDKYVSSCITQTWANGKWENLGEIKLKGSNKTYVVNSKQRIANY